VRQELVSLEGVVSADVSYDERLAKVSYDPDVVTPGRMVATIDATGFDASLIQRP